MKIVAWLALLLTVATQGACAQRPEMEVRTFELHRLSQKDASALLTPYVREGGALAGTDRVLTVRESPERLDQIAALLKKYDAAPANVLLHFQVIEADGFSGTDPDITEVEKSLRELFRYRGYRLSREVTLRTTEGSGYSDREKGMEIEGRVGRVGTVEGKQRVLIEVVLNSQDGTLHSSVNAPLGETTVIGSQKGGPEGGALILAIRPELK